MKLETTTEERARLADQANRQARDDHDRGLALDLYCALHPWPFPVSVIGSSAVRQTRPRPHPPANIGPALF